MKKIKAWLEVSRDQLREKEYDRLESKAHKRMLDAALEESEWPGKPSWTDPPEGFVKTLITIIDKFLESAKAHNEKMDEIQRSHKGEFLLEAKAEQMKKMPNVDAYMGVIRTLADVALLDVEIGESKVWDSPPTADFIYLQPDIASTLTLDEIQKFRDRNRHDSIFCRRLKEVFDDNFDKMESMENLNMDLQSDGERKRNAIENLLKMSYEIISGNDGMTHALYQSPEIGAYNNVCNALGEKPVTEKPDNSGEFLAGFNAGASE